jgi:hypothetical protein
MTVLDLVRPAPVVRAGPARIRLPSRRGVRIALGALWLLDAGLQAAPALFGADWWRTDLAQSAMGQPAALNHSILWAVNIIAAHAAVWNTAFVGVEAALGLALITGRHVRLAILASIPWALGIWWVGEGLGTIPTGFALLASGAPGSALLYLLVGLLAWPASGRDAEAGRQRHHRYLSQPAGLAAWVVLWAGQSLYQVTQPFPTGQVLGANIEEYSQGQPGWVTAVAHPLDALAQVHPIGVSAGLVVIQVAIGLAVIRPRWRTSALVTGIVVSAVFWWAFQFLGTIPGGDATDPGTAPLVILLAVGLLGAGRGDAPPSPRRATRATRRHSRRPPPSWLVDAPVPAT